jgi:hypothetical protein
MIILTSTLIGTSGVSLSDDHKIYLTSTLGGISDVSLSNN